MTKEQIITKITEEFELAENVCEQDLITDIRNDIEEMFEVGEYAFPDFEDRDDYDFLLGDIKNEISVVNEHIDVKFCTWSSKSGTSVLVDPFGYNFEHLRYEIEQEFGAENYEEVSHANLLKFYSAVKSIRKDLVIKRELYQEEISKITEMVESYSEGTRSGCFSNGEVIFTPNDKSKSKFTQYYNPNED